MKTDQSDPAVGFLQTVSVAIAQLKQQLQLDYEQAYPELREIVHLVLDEEESRAWNLTSFPHLLLPDLVEAHIARLNLQPADTRLRKITVPQARHDDVFAPHHFNVIEPPSQGYGAAENDQPVFALCG
jgi:hypothetical protein